jgi:opacity protein-like surface antigen
MRLKILAAAGALAIMASAAQASVVTIDFSGHGTGGAIGNTYASDGLTFTSNADFFQCSGGCPAPNPNGFFAYAHGGSFTATFATPQSDITFQEVSFANTVATAYNASNVAVATVSDTQGFPVNNQLDSLVGAGITYVVFSGSGPAVTNLTFNAGVPEPASWALMVIGFAGLGAVVRARRGIGAARA